MIPTRSPLLISEKRGAAYRLVVRAVLIGLAGWLAIRTGAGISDGSLSSPYGLPLHRSSQPIGFWIAAAFYSAACVFLFCASVGEILYATHRGKHRRPI
jgi:hypothetical protein